MTTQQQQKSIAPLLLLARLGPLVEEVQALMGTGHHGGEQQHDLSVGTSVRVLSDGSQLWATSGAVGLTYDRARGTLRLQGQLEGKRGPHNAAWASLLSTMAVLLAWAFPNLDPKKVRMRQQTLDSLLADTFPALKKQAGGGKKKQGAAGSSMRKGVKVGPRGGRYTLDSQGNKVYLRT